jgi:single-strand DNA-binding protein
MSSLKNKVQLIGNLRGNPEIRTTENGKKLARFQVGNREAYTNAKGNKVRETQWHTVLAWETLAEIVEQFFVKGSKVAIEGRLVNHRYVDKDGNHTLVTEIHMHEITKLGSR